MNRIGIRVSNHSYPHGESGKGADIAIDAAKRKKCSIVVYDDAGAELRSFNPKSFKTADALRKAVMKLAS